MSEGQFWVGVVIFGVWILMVVSLYMGIYKEFKSLVFDMGMAYVFVHLLASLLWFVVLPLTVLAIVLCLVYNLGRFLSTKVNPR